MIEFDQSQTADVVNALVEQSHQTGRQWVTWLGIGSGGGVVALLSFAANLPNPDWALRLLSPALASFIVGVAMSGISVLFLSLELRDRAGHFAAAHNRDDLRVGLSKLPQFIASPQQLSDTLNREREHYSAKAAAFHAEAESDWRASRKWRRWKQGCVSIAALSFLFGAAYPLILIANDVVLARYADRQ